MSKCFICGTESSSFLCKTCNNAVNIEQLCMDISTYKLESMLNELWEDIAKEMKENGIPFKDSVFEIAKDIPSPYRENLFIRCLAARNKSNLQISDYYFPRFEEYAEVCMKSELVSDMEKNRIKGLYLQRFFKLGMWSDAEDVAEDLFGYTHDFPLELYLLLGEYYTRTRRYDKASEILNEGKDIYGTEEFYELITDCVSRSAGIKKEYLPTKEDSKTAYLEFLKKLGISASLPNSKPTYDKINPYTPPHTTPYVKASSYGVDIGTYTQGVIPDDEYPHFDFLSSGNFRNFVAYDTETTGFGLKTDCIVEIGAFRVVDGVIRDEAKFRFQELMRPFGGVKCMKPQASEVTGITNDMLMDARTVREVFNDFADFIGDDVLIGFNNMRFDAPRLRRAGRYAGRIITNPQIDLMLLARHKGIHGKLGELADMFGIVNPSAHRAFADAWTTAKVYLKLLEMKGEM